jgi:hypothetical protein
LVSSCDDSHGRKCFHVGFVAVIVIVMKMGIEQIGDGFVGPLANLRDILARQRRQVTGVHDENAPAANNHRRVAAGIAVT